MTTVIIGAGLAGLTTALALAPRPVTLVVQHPLGKGCSSDWAQGGLAAAVGADDNASLHADDTQKAGVGLCDPTIVAQTTGDGAAVVDFLMRHGTNFDRDATGALQLHLEGAHSRRRIVHVSDQTGHVMLKALIAAVKATPSISMINNMAAVELVVHDGQVRGVVLAHGTHQEVITADHVVLATGGAAALWQHTTNPLGNWGSGLALAARAGALLADLEFMQFHPTAIDIGRDPMPLASEALRGEGAILRNEQGEAFMATYARKDLEPRDVVARAIWQQQQSGHRTFLDLRPLGDGFAQHFPVVASLCASAHLDPAQQPIPIAPAAHYHMGGVKTDASGRSTMAGLWACGEVAATGLHGANRLASNSLLEAVSFGVRVAQDIMGLASPSRGALPQTFPPLRVTSAEPPLDVRGIMTRHVGVLRDRAGIEAAITQLQPLAAMHDKALVGLMIATAALRRVESRGAHTRTDFPQTLTEWQHHQTISLADVMTTEGAL